MPPLPEETGILGVVLWMVYDPVATTGPGTLA